jgi:hypothetical protein
MPLNPTVPTDAQVNAAMTAYLASTTDNRSMFEAMRAALATVTHAAPVISAPQHDDTRRLDKLLSFSTGDRFVLMGQEQHLLDPRGRVAGKGSTHRAAIDNAMGIEA